MNCFPALVLVPISSISVRLPSGVSASLPPVMLLRRSCQRSASSFSSNGSVMPPMLTVLSAASVTVR